MTGIIPSPNKYKQNGRTRGPLLILIHELKPRPHTGGPLLILILELILEIIPRHARRRRQRRPGSSSDYILRVVYCRVTSPTDDKYSNTDDERVGKQLHP